MGGRHGDWRHNVSAVETVRLFLMRGWGCVCVCLGGGGEEGCEKMEERKRRVRALQMHRVDRVCGMDERQSRMVTWTFELERE